MAALVVLLVAPTAASAAPFGSRTLKQGSRGSDVKTLQRLLTRAGFATAADGQFGRGTAKVVRAWESAYDRKVDAKVTRADAKALKRAAIERPKDPVEDEPVVGEPDEDAGDAGPGGAGFVQVEAATLNADGTATPPASAPPEVVAIIEAGNEIATKPYKYGGGHGKWKDSGYDCSGSMSYALHGADLLDQALDSTGFMSWGEAGRGTWVTTYAHGSHSYMIVAGLRFDTSAAKESELGSRWSDEMRSSKGFTVRHPAGL